MEGSGSVDVYTDGSFKDGEGGIGVVIRRAGRVFLLSRSISKAEYAFHAEVRAFGRGLKSGEKLVGDGCRLRMVVDNFKVHTIISTGEPHFIWELFGPRIGRLSERGVSLQMDHVAGLEPGDMYEWGTDKYYHNIADSLAYRGRVRGTHHWSVVDDTPGIANYLASVDWCLDPAHDRIGRAAATFEQAAEKILSRMRREIEALKSEEVL